MFLAELLDASPSAANFEAHLERVIECYERRTLIATARPGMAIWRERLFAFLSRNARPATQFFNLPPNRVVEMGAQVEL